MAKDDILKQLWAGIFFIAGAAVILGAIFFIGFQKGFTQPHFKVTALFDKVGGLEQGAPVRLAGVTVGTVDMIDFLTEEVMERGIRVRLNIFNNMSKSI